MPGRFRIAVVSLLCVLAVGLSASADDVSIEKTPGKGVWTSPRFETFPARVDRFRVTVWFEDQLLGDGKAYLRRAAASCLAYSSLVGSPNSIELLASISV